jgi:type IV pilus assembly protein PilW
MKTLFPKRARLTGFSLVELLVALTIGSVLISGAVYVYSQSRKTSMVSDTVARLQENGRYVFSVIEPDIHLGGYYGFSNLPMNIKFISGGVSTTAIVAEDLQSRDEDQEVAGIDDAQVCGKNFAVNVIATVQGSNDNYGLECDPHSKSGGYLEGTDTLTIRRTTNAPADGLGEGVNGRLQILMSRLSPINQYMLADGELPSSPALIKDFVQVRDLIVNTYYISEDSTEPSAVGLPALRVKQLGDGPAFSEDDDVEIMRGVEDLQVQFGIDTGDYDGTAGIDNGNDENNDGIPDVAIGQATRYVDPDKLPVGFQVVSVRVWIMLRAEQEEQGFVDNKLYKYAGREYSKNDGFRRVLMSRTIQLRNARPY